VPLSSAGNDDDPRPVEFDVFISHASEDKETFVRPLAEALVARNLRPWYDEFTLRPGDSLRRSLDHGLLTSQVGVVVLSPGFFGKRWTNYELDGLVQLAAGDPNQVAGAGSGGRLIPVWHEVSAGDVTRPDGISWKRSDPWLTSFVDCSADGPGSLLGLAPGRTGSCVKEWLAEQTPAFRAAIEIVVIDPSAP
jgi:hypothetical protein